MILLEEELIFETWKAINFLILLIKINLSESKKENDEEQSAKRR